MTTSTLTPTEQRLRAAIAEAEAHVADLRVELATLHEAEARHPEFRAVRGTPLAIEHTLLARPGGMTSVELADRLQRPVQLVGAALRAHPSLFEALDRGARHRPGRWRLRPQTTSEERTER